MGKVHPRGEVSVYFFFLTFSIFYLLFTSLRPFAERGMARHFPFLLFLVTLTGLIKNETVLSRSPVDAKGGKEGKKSDDKDFIIYKSSADNHRPVPQTNEETGRWTSSSGRSDISPPAAGNVSQTVPAWTITTSATKATERKPTSFCEFAPSKNIHYDVCKDSPWMGCVARNDGKMHIGCLDVPGYEYDCLRGFCWSTCKNLGLGQEWCWLGEVFPSWIERMGKKYFPRQSTNDFVRCQTKQDCRRKTAWLLECESFCTI